MAARAIWRGQLAVGELRCAVALYSAFSAAERMSFHIINSKTGNRIRRQMVDSDTGKPVDNEDVVKGYETAEGQSIILEPEEIKAAVPEADKTLDMSAFIPCDQVDLSYLERPYYLAPGDKVSVEAYELIRAGMAATGVVALARTVLFRRVRILLLRPDDVGIIATTLNYDYEVRDADEAFSGISNKRIEGEMLELAQHIIETKKGKFDPATFEDRYENAVIELVQAKIAGRKPKPRPKDPESNVTDLMEALRRSASGKTAEKPAGKVKAKAKARTGDKPAAKPKRKAG